MTTPVYPPPPTPAPELQGARMRRLISMSPLDTISLSYVPHTNYMVIDKEKQTVMKNG